MQKVTIIRNQPTERATAEMDAKDIDYLDIPAFLRRQDEEK